MTVEVVLQAVDVPGPDARPDIGVARSFSQMMNRTLGLTRFRPRVLYTIGQPVKIDRHRSCIEAKWSPPRMPFRYDSAPILASNTAKSQFPKLARGLESVKRSTLEGKFASKYRTAATYLDNEIADELIKIYDERRIAARSSEIAHSYIDALPFAPSRPDGDREQAYAKMLDKRFHMNRQNSGVRRKPC